MTEANASVSLLALVEERAPWFTGRARKIQAEHSGIMQRVVAEVCADYRLASHVVRAAIDVPQMFVAGAELYQASALYVTGEAVDEARRELHDRWQEERAKAAEAEIFSGATALFAGKLLVPSPDFMESGAPGEMQSLYDTLRAQYLAPSSIVLPQA